MYERLDHIRTLAYIGTAFGLAGFWILVGYGAWLVF